MPSYETSHGWNSEPQNIEYRTAECRRVESLCSVFFKIDRIHYFDIRHSLFDIRFFRVSFSIRLAAFQASGGARKQNEKPFVSLDKGFFFKLIKLILINVDKFDFPPTKLNQSVCGDGQSFLEILSSNTGNRIGVEQNI